MRILALSSTFLPEIGGAEIGLLELYNRIAREHEVLLLVSKPPPKEILPPDFKQYDINFDVVYIGNKFDLGKLRTKGIIPPLSLGVYRATKKYIKEWKPDIIHQNYLLPFGMVTMILSKKFNIPFVLSIIGRDAPTKRTSAMRKYYLRKIMSSARVVIFLTAFSQKNPYIPNLEKTIAVPYGVDTESYRPDVSGGALRSGLGLEEKASILFCIQRLAEVKRVDIIIRALPYVLREFPSTYLIIGGTGPEEKNLKELTKRLNLEKKVIFTGYIPEKELPGYFALCDIFVFHSTYETFGIVLAQAMAMRKPIVSVRSTAIPYVVDDGVTGLLAEPNNELDMAEKIITLLKNPSLATTLADNAYRKAIREYDWKVVVQKYIEVFSEILQMKTSEKEDGV
ncbi:glycosyltransferase family 4 protein [Candidatus Sumerlaeota bacterium]|nr:glycosyltransferase family 4 protein [Candidatus Sumerlaeota bacterium]